MVAAQRTWLMGGGELGDSLARHLAAGGLQVWHQAAPSYPSDSDLSAAMQAAAQVVETQLKGLEAFIYLASANDLDGSGGAGVLAAVTRETGRFVLGAREAVRLLSRGGGGNLICVCDIAGLSGRAGRAATAAASAALLATAKSLAKELGRQRIAVNALCHGLLEEYPVGCALTTAEQDLFNAMGLGRPGRLSHLAANLRHLVQGEHWMTGQALRMDDGLII